MMRQAGRILAEYRAVREKAGSFIQLATTPELAAEVTIQPVDLLGVDAAIIFSDILVVPEGMGLPYEMAEQKGPIFPATVNTIADWDKLRIADPENDLGYVLEAIRLTKQGLADRVRNRFCGRTFTIFCYMTEGKGQKHFQWRNNICTQILNFLIYYYKNHRQHHRLPESTGCGRRRSCADF